MVLRSDEGLAVTNLDAFNILLNFIQKIFGFLVKQMLEELLLVAEDIQLRRKTVNLEFLAKQFEVIEVIKDALHQPLPHKAEAERDMAALAVKREVIADSVLLRPNEVKQAHTNHVLSLLGLDADNAVRGVDPPCCEELEEIGLLSIQ